MHLITFTLCQALQIFRSEKTDHQPSPLEIFAVVKQTYSRQVNKYRITNQDDHCEEKRMVYMRKNNLDSILDCMVRNDLSKKHHFNIYNRFRWFHFHNLDLLNPQLIIYFNLIMCD